MDSGLLNVLVASDAPSKIFGPVRQIVIADSLSRTCDIQHIVDFMT